MGIEELANKGIATIGDLEKSKEQTEKTFIIVGIGRGGTSLISGTLAHLGLFTGERSISPVFEDIKLSKVMENRDFQNVRQIIDDYNRHPVWAFKRPSIINHLKEMHPLWRNPIYLFVFKDIASIAIRNNISMRFDILSCLKSAQVNYQKIIDFIGRQEINGLILSYEKLIANKEAFVDALVNIITQESISKEKRKKALEFITPNSKEYLEKSRITKTHGIIDHISPAEVRGWVKFLHNNEAPEVELFINGIPVIRIHADHFRPDMLAKKLHSTGKCGFIFRLEVGQQLSRQDTIQVRAVDDIHDLPFGKRAANQLSSLPRVNRKIRWRRIGYKSP